MAVHICNIILSTGIVPDGWAVSIIRDILQKKVYFTDPSKRGGISMFAASVGYLQAV